MIATLIRLRDRTFICICVGAGLAFVLSPVLVHIALAAEAIGLIHVEHVGYNAVKPAAR